LIEILGKRRILILYFMPSIFDLYKPPKMKENRGLAHKETKAFKEDVAMLGKGRSKINLADVATATSTPVLDQAYYIGEVRYRIGKRLYIENAD
jgi:hypothetical protein